MAHFWAVRFSNGLTRVVGFKLENENIFDCMLWSDNGTANGDTYVVGDWLANAVDNSRDFSKNSTKALG